MINSLFIMSTSGCVVIEKHWKGMIQRYVAEDFYADHVLPCDNPKDVLPVVNSGKYLFVHVLHCDLIFLAVLRGEALVMMILEILQRIIDIFDKYFDDVNEDTIRDNFVTAYEILEEVLDDGFPMSIETSVLKDLVPPPSFSRLLKNLRPGDSHTTTSALDSTSTPWRKHGIRYSNNEIFFDVIEELHTVIDADGRIISSEVQGLLECNCRLTGMPEILVQFKNPEVLSDTAFHSCVRKARFSQDSSIWFTPPDGQFVLASYNVVGTESQFQAPFYVKPQIGFGDGGGRVSIMVGLRGSFTPSNNKKEGQVQDLKLTVPLPNSVDSCTIDQSQGSAMFDYSTREIVWEVGKLSNSKTANTPSLTATIHIRSDAQKPSVIPPVLVEYSQTGSSFSGLKVDSVNILNEGYKPYKGIRAFAKAGHFVVRS